jgi:hypothetical protein
LADIKTKRRKIDRQENEEKQGKKKKTATPILRNKYKQTEDRREL